MSKYGPLTVNVTQKNIDEGLPQDCERCALAKAICELPNVLGTEVSSDEILIIYKTDFGMEDVHYEVNEDTQQFIAGFDEESDDGEGNGTGLFPKNVKPCTLILE